MSATRVVSDEIVSLVVSKEGGGLRAAKLPPDYPLTFQLGVAGAPLYEVEETDPDERMSVRVLPDGERLAANEPLVDHLPPGKYYLVKTALLPGTSRVLLGNDWGDPTPNVRSLLEARNPEASRRLRLGVDFTHDFHACVVGPPSSQVLMGAVTLAYGDPQVLFFSFMAPDSQEAASLLVVVPVEGEWVLDGATAGTRLLFWKTKGVIQFIAHLGVDLLRDEHIAEFGRPGAYADHPRRS